MIVGRRQGTTDLERFRQEPSKGRRLLLVHAFVSPVREDGKVVCLPASSAPAGSCGDLSKLEAWSD